MMKIKGFTLIEILIASTIFTVVVMTAVSAFALIRHSNYKSADKKVAASCARQIEDFIKAEITSSNTPPRIELIKQRPLAPAFYDIFSVPEFDPANYPVLGLALFQGGRVKLIFKNPATGDKGYTYRYMNVSLDEYTNNIKLATVKNINTVLVNGTPPSSPLFSDECRAIGGSETFRLKFRERYPRQTATANVDTSDDIYEVQMEDSLFRYLGSGAGNLDEQAAKATAQGTVSRINLDVTSSVSQI